MFEYIDHINNSIHWANLDVSKLNQEIMDIHGITSKKVKCLLNNICDIDDATYLEIGVFRGATFCSAIHGNRIRSVGIDNWSSPFLTPNHLKHQLSFLNKDKHLNPKEELLENVKKYGKKDDISIYKANYLDFDFNTIGPVNIVFYDGDTKYHDRYCVLNKILPIMSDLSILIIDDFNWESELVYKILEEAKVEIAYKKILLTNGEDPNDFWNGIGIFLIRKVLNVESFFYIS